MSFSKFAPPTWPLARLMFPIRNLVKQMQTLPQTYCFETAVTCRDAEAQGSFVKRMATHLGQFMASYLAETVTALFQRVLSHPAKGLVNETNAALLTQKFWVQAIYTELLHASSRFSVREKEQQRPPNGLVKVCLAYDGKAEQKPGRKKASDASFESMVGMSSWVDSLFISFPAAWMPLVVEAIREKTLWYLGGTGQRGAVASILTRASPRFLTTGNLASQSRDGRLTKVGVVPSCNFGSMLIGSPLPLTSLLRFSVESMMESFMTSSTRRLRWRGTMPHTVELW